MIDILQYWFERLPEYEHHIDVTDYLPLLLSWGTVLGIVVAVALVLILSLVYKFFKKGKWLTIAFCIVWLCGFAIYDVGLYIGESRFSLLASVPMAIIHAFEMFLLESDVAAIHEPFHDNWIFMFIFSLVHLLAAFISLVFAIKHFGFNIIAGFQMMLEAYLKPGKQTSYVFWAMDDASYLLAKSVKCHHEQNKDKDYRIIVVRTSDDADTTSQRNGMARLFNFLSLKNIHLERLLDLNCLTTNSFYDIVHLHLHEPVQDVLRGELELRQLAAIIRKKTRGTVHLFFLSDDDAANIQAVANVKRDKTINEFADGEGHQVVIHCRARYNSVHRVIEDEQHHNHIRVNVVDASHISVETLKQRVELHPASFVKIENDATVSTPFNALVVGFGEVGSDAVRFLYEFGAFVKTGTVDGPVERSDFRCHVVDPSMSRLAGLFRVNAPSVSVGSQDEDALIALYDMNPASHEFYCLVERLIKDLNYVVVALDDDEQNISLAVRIFRLAVRYRKWSDDGDCLSRFRILVRVARDSDGHIRRIAEQYNRLWAAEVQCENNGKRTHQRVVKTTDSLDVPITIFGMMEDTFTHSYVVDDRLTREARRYKERYDQSVEASTGDSSPDWDAEYNDLMQLSPEYIGFSPTLSGIMRLRRTQRQNFENCYHLLTKQLLARTALGEKQYAALSGSQLARAQNTVTYTCRDGRQPDGALTRVLDVLARTEHLRWVASHEILGYKDYGTEDDKDEARLLHGCLKPWESLSERVQSYDYNVVDVSLDIRFTNNNKE